MTGPSDKAIEAARQFAQGEEAVRFVYPIIRADLAKDPEFLAMVVTPAVESLRADVAGEIAEEIRSGRADAACRIGPLNVADWIEREFGGES